MRHLVDRIADAKAQVRYKDAAWKIINERLDALQQACAALSQQAGLSALAPLTEKLQSMSQDIAAHASKTAGGSRTARR